LEQNRSYIRRCYRRANDYIRPCIVVVDHLAAGRFIAERVEDWFTSWVREHWRTPERYLVGPISLGEAGMYSGGDELVLDHAARTFPPGETPVMVVTLHGVSLDFEDTVNARSCSTRAAKPHEERRSPRRRNRSRGGRRRTE
jgi:hypothetical protein